MGLGVDAPVRRMKKDVDLLEGDVIFWAPSEKFSRSEWLIVSRKRQDSQGRAEVCLVQLSSQGDYQGGVNFYRYIGTESARREETLGTFEYVRKMRRTYVKVTE